MKQRLRYTALLLEFALTGLLFIWTEQASITWQRKWKTISMTVHDVNGDDEVMG